MIRTIVFIIVLGFSFSFLNSQTITITSPKAASNWYYGKSYTISWTIKGDMDEYVKIRLLNETGTTKILDISNRTINDGNFRSWKVPDSIPSGKYVLRVKTVDDAVSDDSGKFNISKASYSPKPIKTTQPVVSSPQVQRKQSTPDQFKLPPDLTITEAWIETGTVRFIVFRIKNENWENAKLDTDLANKITVQIYALGERAFVVGIDKRTIENLNSKGEARFQFQWDYTIETRIWIDFNKAVTESDEGNNTFLFEQ